MNAVVRRILSFVLLVVEVLLGDGVSAMTPLLALGGRGEQRLALVEVALRHLERGRRRGVLVGGGVGRGGVGACG